ncbi:hypothetical protein M0813_24648 [Anaeramoeba flamelloides]|uniref:B box-type domain-containing protein n=1 Tax=Anaeramoeba flamelloides TaxID=1746091 RepID=A0ABQ8Y594_9EUKA|nr:hypothetical protein M0813_24648 [Anaeramoeba flamelloides]
MSNKTTNQRKNYNKEQRATKQKSSHSKNSNNTKRFKIQCIRCSSRLTHQTIICCKKCISIFCIDCDKKVHKNNKHQRIKITHHNFCKRIREVQPLIFCSRHPNKYLKYYCKKCKFFHCSKCLQNNKSVHEPILLAITNGYYLKGRNKKLIEFNKFTPINLSSVRNIKLKKNKILLQAKKNKHTNSKKENKLKQTLNNNYSNKDDNINNEQGDSVRIYSKNDKNKNQNNKNKIVLEKIKENNSNNSEINNKSINNTDGYDDDYSDDENNNNNNNNNNEKGMKMTNSKTSNEIKLESESRSQTETKSEVDSETSSSNTTIRTVNKNKKRKKKEIKSKLHKNLSDSESWSGKESQYKSESESESDEKEKESGEKSRIISSNQINPQKRVLTRIKLNQNERNRNGINRNRINRNRQSNVSNPELTLSQRLANLGRFTFKRPRSYSLLGPRKMDSNNSNYLVKNGFTIKQFKPKALLSIGPDFQLLPKMMKAKTKELELFQDLCKNMQKIGTTTRYAYECFYLFSYLNGKQDNELKSTRPKEKKIIARVKRRVMRSFKEARKKMQRGRSLFKVKICSNALQTYEEGEIHIDRPLFRLIYKEDKSEIVREKWNNSIRIYIHKTIREIFVIKLTKKNQTFIIRADSSHEQKVCLLTLYLFCRYSKRPHLFGMCPEIDRIPSKSLLSSEIPRPIFYRQTFEKRLSGWLLVKKKQSLMQLMERFYEKNGVNFILYIVLKRGNPYQRGYLKIRRECIKIGLGNLTFFRFAFRDNPELFNHKSENNILKITSRSFAKGLSCLSQSEQDKQLIIKSVLYFKQKWLQQEKKKKIEKMKLKSKSKSKPKSQSKSRLDTKKLKKRGIKKIKSKKIAIKGKKK